MRISMMAVMLLYLAVGCSKPSTPPEDSAASAEAEPAREATSEAETEAAEEGDAEEEPQADSFGLNVAAPDFEGLVGVDDQNHSLADYADAKAVALIFTCNHCPVAVAYEDRMVALHNDYTEKGVQLVAVNVNNVEEDRLPAMKERAEAKGFEFPYLYDESQQIGRDYGATVTPHIFLLDGERKLAYVGAIDDNMNAEEVTANYLRDAIDAVLAGNAPSTAETKPVGCGIAYE